MTNEEIERASEDASSNDETTNTVPGASDE
jgi:hypothetical protein